MADLVTVDTEALNRWIFKFNGELGVAVDKTIRYVMRLTLRDVIKGTPPKTPSLGREKIGRDFKRSSEPLEASTIHEGLARGYLGRGFINKPTTMNEPTTMNDDQAFEFQMARANDLILRQDYTGMNALLRNIGGALSKWTVVPFSNELFTQAPRGSGGGVKQQRKFVFQRAQWRATFAKLAQHVGRLKASWLPAFYEAGGKQQAQWIHRHLAGVRGHVIPPAATGTVKVFTAVSFAFGVGKTRELLNKTLRFRAKVAAKDFRLFLRGVKDVSSIE